MSILMSSTVGGYRKYSSCNQNPHKTNPAMRRMPGITTEASDSVQWLDIGTCNKNFRISSLTICLMGEKMEVGSYTGNIYS